MKLENGKETPVTISIGLAMSNHEDISLSQCKGTFDGRYVVHDSHTIDTMTMELAEAESDYMTWSRSLPEGGICIVTIREDKGLAEEDGAELEAKIEAAKEGLEGGYDCTKFVHGEKRVIVECTDLAFTDQFTIPVMKTIADVFAGSMGCRYQEAYDFLYGEGYNCDLESKLRNAIINTLESFGVRFETKYDYY